MKVEISLVEKNYDVIEESKLDSDKVWQGEITNVFFVFFVLS
jgi:hypothetical protein